MPIADPVRSLLENVFKAACSDLSGFFQHYCNFGTLYKAHSVYNETRCVGAIEYQLGQSWCCLY